MTDGIIETNNMLKYGWGFEVYYRPDDGLHSYGVTGCKWIVPETMPTTARSNRRERCARH